MSETIFNATIDVWLWKWLRSRGKDGHFLSSSCNSCFKALKQNITKISNFIQTNWTSGYKCKFIHKRQLTLRLGVNTGNLPPSTVRMASITSFASASCNLIMKSSNRQNYILFGRIIQKMRKHNSRDENTS